MKDQMESSLKLLKFITDSQFTLTQVNGQRKLGPPPGWNGPPPNPKCEIFVGSIPRNYYEPDLVLIFGVVGQIYELRLMMDFSGMNRGYCFIMYTTEEAAARAVKELDQYEIYPGKRIGVVASTNNCRLYINQLPQNIDSETIVKRFYYITNEVDKVNVYRNMNGFIIYVLISYKTHRDAAMGRRRLVPEAASLFKYCEVNVEWANPNMIPSNVLEESGTCDEQGNVKIIRTMIGLVEPKKSAVRAKYKKTDTQYNVTNNEQNYKLFDSKIGSGRATKFLPKNFTKNFDHASNYSTIEKCQLKSSLVCSICQLVHSRANECKVYKDCDQTWDNNGIRKNSLDRFLLYENFKENCAQHNQLNPILPSISTYLKKGTRQKNVKWNTVQTCPDETFKKDGGVDKYIIPYQFKGQLHNQDNSSLERLRSNDSFSIDDKSCVNYDQKNSYKSQLQISSTEGNLSYHQTLSDTNLQSANYSQNYTFNGAEPNNETICIQSSDQTGNKYSVQYVQGPVFLQEPSYGQFSQQFLPNSFKQVVIGQQFGWYFVKSLPNQQLCDMTRQIPKYCNGIQSDLNYFSNQTVNSFQKAQGGCYGDVINYGYHSNPSMVDFDHDKFAHKNFVRPTISMQNEQQLVENNPDDVKCYMRPILKGTTGNIKVNY